MKDLIERISVVDGQPTTTTLHICEVFGKRHDNVVKKLDTSLARLKKHRPEWVALNFKERDYIDERGKRWKIFELTRKGFDFAALGFTGEKADVFKVDYIDAFEQMETRVREGFTLPEGMANAARLMSQALEEIQSTDLVMLDKDSVRQVVDCVNKSASAIADTARDMELVVSLFQKEVERRHGRALIAR